MAPLLSSPLGDRIIAPFHVVLLPKFKVMKIFPLVMRDISLECGGLGLYSLKIEPVAQNENLFVPLYAADVLTQSLLRVVSEHMQLELGVVESFFMLKHDFFLSY